MLLCGALIQVSVAADRLLPAGRTPSPTSAVESANRLPNAAQVGAESRPVVQGGIQPGQEAGGGRPNHGGHLPGST